MKPSAVPPAATNFPPSFDFLTCLHQHFSSAASFSASSPPQQALLPSFPQLSPIFAAAMLAKVAATSGANGGGIPSSHSAFLQPAAATLHLHQDANKGQIAAQESACSSPAAMEPPDSPGTPPKQQQTLSSELLSPSESVVVMGGGEMEGNCENNGEDKLQPLGLKRKNRIGGSSVKTAEVWRFFEQLPPAEQAARCLCFKDDGEKCYKIIKATNSSTTGMIRHLRSCHAPQYAVLQEARKNSLIMKALKSSPDDASRHHILQQIQDLEMCSPSAIAHHSVTKTPKSELEKTTMEGGICQAKHSVDSIIGGRSNSFAENLAELTENSEIHQLRIEEEGINGSLKAQTLNNIGSLPNPQGVYLNFMELLSQNKQLAPKLEFNDVAGEEKKAQKRIADEAAAETLEKMNGMSEESVTPRRHTEFHAKRIKMEVTADENKEEMVEEKQIKPFVQQQQFCFTPEQQQTQLKKSRRVAKNAADSWPSDSKEAQKLNEQIALMLLMDNCESMVEQPGFCQFIKCLFPKYRMPSASTFRERIIPQVRTNLTNLQFQLQCNNPYGFNGLAEAVQSTVTVVGSNSRRNSHDRSGVSPASTEESGFQEDIENTSTSSSGGVGTTLRKGEAFEALVQHSIRSAQNISQSFSYSIELNSNGLRDLDSDTSSSVCSDMLLPSSKIEDFVECTQHLEQPQESQAQTTL